ncbi:MAG: hypothetical protein J5680_06495 [Neisseriaceae bacterium]|nr:hypothetical protein [Neisseriaceae bacterium]MBR5675512.1 hypothetical protein [Neisseriaceae bacterium]
MSSEQLGFMSCLAAGRIFLKIMLRFCFRLPERKIEALFKNKIVLPDKAGLKT